MEAIFSSHHFELSPHELSKFTQFLTLFMEYNSHTNLSAIRDDVGIIEKHFVDSLYGASIISDSSFFHSSDRKSQGHTQETLENDHIPDNTSPSRLLDIGSGGGFPGIPLKIVMSDLHITLLDSVGKKVKAMNYFVEKLGFQDIHALQERAEVLAKSPEHAGRYDFVVSRATAYITDILVWAVPFLKPTGKIILYKMPSEDEGRDMKKVIKKLGLTLEGELFYEIGGRERAIYSISYQKK